MINASFFIIFINISFLIFLSRKKRYFLWLLAHLILSHIALNNILAMFILNKYKFHGFHPLAFIDLFRFSFLFTFLYFLSKDINLCFFKENEK